MKLVTVQGGHAIGVYDPVKQNKQRVHELIRDKRIKHFAAADYSRNSELEKLMHKIIDYTQASFELNKSYLEDLEESEL